MDSCTNTRTRATTLLSVRAPRAQVVEQAALRRAWQATSIAPTFAGFKGGAIAEIGTAAVTDLMVTDHPYSTRLGPPSCSPPV